MIIDSQVHSYAANTPNRPWRDRPPNWPDHVTGNEMVAAMDEVGVDGAILVSLFLTYGYDASHAIEVQRAHPGRIALVKPVDPDDPVVDTVIADWKKTPGAVGIRLRMIEGAGQQANHQGLARVARAAARHELPVNILCHGNLDAATALVDRHPSTRFVIDHLGLTQPDVTPAPFDVWDDLPKVLGLARRPNAAIKVSGVCAMSHLPYPYPDIWPSLSRVFEAWGFERCLWGTDWTRTARLFGYKEAIEAFRLSDRLSGSEKAMLMGGACSKTYGWSPYIVPV